MRILVAVAHADDETIGCFSVLTEPGNEIFVLHGTDSAPRNLKYALRAGFLTRDAYKVARRNEVRQALTMAGIPESRHVQLDIADQESPLHWQEIRRAAEDVKADLIYTHAYEGGHGDHDALAFALHTLPNVWEFPLYHAAGGHYTPHAFVEGAASKTVILTKAQQSRKAAMLACFRSQKRVIDGFPIGQEHFRPMKAYDFNHPPHGGKLYYEIRKLGWTWPEWHAAILAG
ncbi:MAG: PIG-L family deacetylase [Acidobacteria bacterium]|nr:PIG-L family deacetylase [Acidobacteriota bacterium]